MKSIFRDWFQEVVGNIEIECSGGMLGVGGDKDDRRALFQSFKERKSILLGHPDIEKNPIGFESGDQSGSLAHGGRLTDDIDIGNVAE